MQVCSQRHEATVEPIEFLSKSSPDKDPYRVYLFRQDKEGRIAAPMCTCMPFLTGRKKEAAKNGTPIDETFFACSHIKKAREQVCDWSEKDPTYPGHRIDNKCPKCNRPTVDMSAVGAQVLVTNDDKRAQLEEARKLAAELKGEKYEPLPVPTAHVPVVDATITAEDGAFSDQQVDVTLDGEAIMSFVWDGDGPRVLFYPSDDHRHPDVIDLRDRMSDRIKEIEWPAT